MLKLKWRRVLAAVALATAAGLPLSAHASAGGGVDCGPFAGNCNVTASGGSTPSPSSGSGSGSSGSGSSGGGGGDCKYQGHAFRCYSAQFGWFDQVDGCYYELMSPQPDATSAYWVGHKPGDGAVYTEACPLISGIGTLGGSGRWFQNPPPGYGGAVDVAALAQEAVRKMGLVGPAIGIAPKVGGKSAVGLPVWLWDNVTPTTWGPNTATAAAGGVTVTATGSATQIVWSMGDGSTVTCVGPGVAYQPSFGDQAPACGHVYAVTSAAQPGGAYAINATATWVVNWTATTGQQGSITVTRQSATTAVIGELQVLNNQ